MIMSDITYIICINLMYFNYTVLCIRVWDGILTSNVHLHRCARFRLLTEVCHYVQVEPHLQPITGEIRSSSSAIMQDSVCLDIEASGLWGGRFEHTFFDVRVFNPHAASNRECQLSYYGMPFVSKTFLTISNSVQAYRTLKVYFALAPMNQCSINRTLISVMKGFTCIQSLIHKSNIDFCYKRFYNDRSINRTLISAMKGFTCIQ